MRTSIYLHHGVSSFILKLVLISAFACMAIMAQAQATQEVTWNLLREESGVKVYYGIGDCDTQSMLWLKVENTTLTRVAAHVDLLVSQGGEETTIGQCHLDVAASETVVFDCNNQSPHVISMPVTIVDAGTFTCSIFNMFLSVIPD